MIVLRLRLPSIPAAGAPGVVTTIRDRFHHEAGTMVIDAIRSLLGTDALYLLSPEYAAIKPQLKRYRPYPGKSAEQPLILTGEMINSLTAIPQGDTLVIEVQDGAAVADDGFDYAEFWQSGEGSAHGFTGVDFLGKGLDLVESKLDELLADIISEEMML